MSTLAQLGNAINREIDLRMAGRVAAVAMPLFSNAPRNWEPPDANPVAGKQYLIPNEACWLHQIRNQLTGIHMFVSGGWHQSYGMWPITRRHGISVSHNGPQPGTSIWFINTDGTAFKTTMQKWICDNEYNAGRVSDTQQFTQGTTPNRQGPADLSIYRFADELPEWVRVCPIAHAGMTLAAFEDAGVPIPTVAFSQGSPDDQYSDDPLAWTPNNRLAYINNRLEDFLPWRHGGVPGDSGSLDAILCNGILYAYRALAGGNYDGLDGPILSQNLTYLNSLIARAQAAAGDSTVYSVACAPMPTINDSPKRSIASWKNN